MRTLDISPAAVSLAVLFSLLLHPAAAAAQPAPSALPRPSGCVLDQVGVLEPSSVEAIEAECARVRAEGHELAVVVMATAGARGSDQYALDLFNAWRLGGPDDSDGVLLYAAIEDRAAEIILGDDLDTPANTARSDRVMMQVIVPAFRAGSPDRAMREGARHVAANLFRAGPGAYRRPGAPDGAGDRGDGVESAGGSSRSGAPYGRPPRSHYNYPPYRSPSLFERLKSSLGGYGHWVALGVLALILLVALRLFLRHRPRKCEKCGSPMIRFGEEQDDAHLTSGQRKEEELGSVDYDVWACESCDHIIERRYAAIFTGYRTCGSCQARTESSRSRTIQPATQYSTGLAEVTVTCHHCGKTSTHTRVIPRTPPPSRSSGGGGSSGGGRSYGGGGGGGRSSGGGSSGRW